MEQIAEVLQQRRHFPGEKLAKGNLTTKPFKACVQPQKTIEIQVCFLLLFCF